ncbi:MAG: KTSC domain-containing protein [Verrucomicrobia bacterium]|nr:KTSC domain-containing protein [Verrucomicrobiota bacterium]
MSMILVNSSAIRAVGYDGYTLAVQFHTSDTVYTHTGVPYSVYAGLMQAGSKGAFYNLHIRGKYR